MNDTNTAKRNTGKLMMNYLTKKGRKNKKAGLASTVELAKAARVTVAQAYSRLYWMEVKEGKLESVGKGENRMWRKVKVAR